MSSADDTFTFRLASPADEPEIRRLVGAVAMPGSVPVRFEREPDYFLGTTVMGDPCDVLIARHGPSGALAGVVCRSERTLLANGVPRRVVSIGQVRASPRFPGRWLLHRGLPALRALGGADLLHVAVVATDNDRARAVMMERRPPGGLRARRLSGITTWALLLRDGQGAWGRPHVPPPGVTITTAAAVGAEPVAAFLRDEGARRQLFPAWTVADLTDGRATRGMALGDVAVAVTDRGGAIVGTLGCWDQRSFKQDVIDAWPPVLAGVRPVWNAVASLLGGPALPPPGGAIPSAFAALVCVARDDPAVFRALLGRTARMAARRGCGVLMLGLADPDPLLGAVGHWPRITYRSDLFAVSWSDERPGAELDARVPYWEIATL